MKPAFINRITLAALYLCFALGAAFLVLLPRLLPQILGTKGLLPEPGARYLAALVCWLLGAAGGLFILYTLIRMMRSLTRDPFITENVLHLRNMGLTALVMALLTFIAAALYFKATMLLVGSAELLCALFSLTLRGVFAKAVEYREENALTI